MFNRKLLIGAGALALVALGALAGCTGPVGPAGPAGSAGPAGPSGPLAPGVDSGMNVTLELSKPANGTNLVAGEKMAVTVTLKDELGAPLTKDDFATIGLYAYGPQDPTRTISAVKLLNATTDRTKTPHHFIDLLTNTDVQVSGNVLKYEFKPVTDELPGTYTVSLRAIKKGTPPVNQAFLLENFQLGTATVETPVVEKEKCASCHLGADSGQFYFAHTDVSARSPYGSPSIDSIPVATCKSCHNNEGYAAYRLPSDTNVRVPDNIVFRVHGVHFGEELTNPANTDTLFKDYAGVIFPANVKNCTSCHTTDAWKTKPSRLACGACHDQIDWTTGKSVVADGKDHAGGPQTSDAVCATCHTPDAPGVAPISEAHKVDPPAFTHTVELALSQPANGKFYVAGESPKLTVTVKNASTGAAIAPSTIAEPADAKNVQPGEFRRANLYVSGPREVTMPVLTTKASQVGPTAGTYANNDLRVLKDASKADPEITRTDTGIVYQLDDVKDLKPGTYTAFVETLAPAPDLGGWAVLNFQVGTETADKKVATNCTQCHGTTTMHSSYFAVEFNPDICKSCHDYKRQIEGKSGWTSSNNGYGAGPLSRRVHGVHFGAYLDKPGEVHATVDYSEVIFPQDVRNCVKCHDVKESSVWKEKPSRLACLACHDNGAALTHASLNTVDLTPAEPFSGDEVETCKVCHGAGREFSPDKVHDISNPYVPPYPREPEK